MILRVIVLEMDEHICDHDLRLPLRFLLGHGFTDLFRYQVVPLELTARTLVHRGLERVQLRDALQFLDRLDGLLQEIDVRVSFSGFLTDSFEHSRILLQVFCWPVQEMLEVQPMRVRMPGTLLRQTK